MNQRVLTGITTTGTPHLGNYVGAIRPAIEASHRPGQDSFLFLADLHALIKCSEPQKINDSTREIAATWLALGLDVDKTVLARGLRFYLEDRVLVHGNKIMIFNLYFIHFFM